MIGKTISLLASKKYVVYAIFVTLTVITLLLTLTPSDNFEGSSIFEYDKLGHFLMFFSWSFMLGFSLLISSKKRAPLLIIFIAGSMFGIAIEVTQEFLPFGRSASIADAIADIAGSLTAVLFLSWMKSRYLGHLNPSSAKK